MCEPRLLEDGPDSCEILVEVTLEDLGMPIQTPLYCVFIHYLIIFEKRQSMIINDKPISHIFVCG